MALDLEILGRGVYTPQEVARLIGGTAQEVLRWSRGHGTTEPLWNSYYQSMDDSTELSFADMIELRVVRELRRAGLSLQAIRYAIVAAKAEYGFDLPLSSKSFKTDGREILMVAMENDDQLISLSPKRLGQRVFRKIVEQSFVDLEYDGQRPVLWRPRQAKHIVIDPTRFFGDPVIDDFGVSSKMLKAEYDEFKDLDYLSSIYEIPKAMVKDAISFEESLDKRQAENIGQSSVRS